MLVTFSADVIEDRGERYAIGGVAIVGLARRAGLEAVLDGGRCHAEGHGVDDDPLRLDVGAQRVHPVIEGGPCLARRRGAEAFERRGLAPP